MILVNYPNNFPTYVDDNIGLLYGQTSNSLLQEGEKQKKEGDAH